MLFNTNADRCFLQSFLQEECFLTTKQTVAITLASPVTVGFLRTEIVKYQTSVKGYSSVGLDLEPLAIG